MKSPRYVLITPAHNEEAHLERTIHSVLAQTCKPLRWVIVNDASTDRTGEIAAHFAKTTDFITAVNVSRDGKHAFSKKARAFNEGLKHLSGVDYDFIGNLDSDISVGENYFENVFRLFETDDAIGVAGGIIHTKIGDRFVTCDTTLDSVAGAVQMFRKKCFEQIGSGYLPLPYGGIDAAAEIIAKMKGWKVRKSVEDKAWEHRQTGTATARPLRANYRLGCRFHSLGYGLLFYSLRCLYRLRDEPVFIGSCSAYLGFAASCLRRQPVALPPPVVEYLRRSQREKLLEYLPFRSRRTAHRG